jgi:hypothetical protein
MLASSEGVAAVISARPGYWDVDRCSWVGVDPVYVVPPLRHAEHPHDRAPGAAVPAPRSEDDTEALLDREPGAAASA